MLEVANFYPELQTIIAGAPGLEAKDYESYIANRDIKIIFGKTYQLLQHSKAALVTSGTATLEAALLCVPQVVCYYVIWGKIASFIFQHFFHIPYISLVNLIGQKTIVQELFGNRFSKEQIHEELERILHDSSYRNSMLNEYNNIIRILGNEGASDRAATLIFNYLSI